MNILHISTSDSGGAGKAALRTHVALLEAGVKSKFLCLYKNSSSVPEVYEFQRSTIRSIKKEILNRFGLKLPNSTLNNLKIKDLKGEYEIFTFPRTDYILHNHDFIKEADIVQLHWVSGFIDYPSFFTNIKKPVVWTLHDMNPFQGGFHYLNDKEINSTLFHDVENEFLNLKKESIRNVPTLHIVTPSKWLGEAARTSCIFKNRPVHDSFYYGIDIETFKPIKKEVACEALGIPIEGIKIFFAAETILNKRKGFDLLLAALKILNKKHDLTLVTIGHNLNDQLLSSFKCYNLGNIKDERFINIAYNVADCVVIPSREDNFPNVMLEALACGIPVISFPIGGMAEVIKTGENGILAENLSSESLAEALSSFLTNKYSFDCKKIREGALYMFNKQQHAGKYMKLYQEVLSFI